MNRSTCHGEPNPLPRVVAVGFNRCATRSLARLFACAGHPVVHQKLPAAPLTPYQGGRRIGRIMRLNFEAGRPVFHGLEHYTFYADLIDSGPQGSFDGNSLFRRILTDYPDTILLLNWREREHWIRSRLHHGHGEFAERERRLRGLSSLDELAEAWRCDWDRHLSAVRTFMAGLPQQLVEFHIERDNIEELVLRLPAYGLRAEDFTAIGSSRGRRALPLEPVLRRWWSHHRRRSQR